MGTQGQLPMGLQMSESGPDHWMRSAFRHLEAPRQLAIRQETQLALTNRATRLEVSQRHQTGYRTTVPYVRYGIC